MFEASCPKCGAHLEHICNFCTGRIMCSVRGTARERNESCAVSAIICPGCRKVLGIRKGEQVKKFFLSMEAWPDGSETWMCCDAETGDQIPFSERVKTEEEAREIAKENGYTYELNEKENEELLEKMELLGKW